jgi:hypothetical protein
MGEQNMIVNYEAVVGGSLEIDDNELDGLTKDQTRQLIQERVDAAAYEEFESNLDWSIE